MIVHQAQLQAKIDAGWVVVDHTPPRVTLAHPDHTCLRVLTTGRCLLDVDHRGRCATVVFYCDACGKTRRGNVYRTINDTNGDPDVALCFMCVREAS